mmetsp:Transcript_10554/g.16232  ORF Transcript_10554/g.16232 Transcript_10554/m.16232 type:complete len:315 (-) Transcript_10554:3319-4263(-)
MGCDTFVAYPPTAPEGLVIFGKNSDRPAGERQSIRRYPSQTFPTDGGNNKVTVQCTYISIPQVPKIHAVLLSQIDWMWGAEMGANEHGVVIGNEAVWTVVPDERKSLLLGMDLVRLGLERSTSAPQALQVITELLQEHGQGGACAENDPSFTYHNAFLIADCSEAWILETAGRHWVAEKVTRGGRNISNGLTIRTNFEKCSVGLEEFAKENKIWDGKEPLDFALCFSEGGVDDLQDSRQGCGEAFLKRHESKKSLDKNEMTKILQDHKSGICMHGGFETTSSMISELRIDGKARHWMTGKPYPCKNKFLLQDEL